MNIDPIERKYAFVVGVARSGTTAMTELLNAHRSICIGMERYKKLYRRKREFPLQLLSKERFFSFEPNDTNQDPMKGAWRHLYESMAEKWDTASVVGDKESYAALDFVLESIPNPHIIFMLRSVEQVASSWNVRAAAERDAWPANNDFRVAVNRWNEANSIAYLLSQSVGERLFVIDYERFFSGSRAYADALLRFLGVQADEPKFAEAYDLTCSHYRHVVSRKQPVILERQEEFIEREANRRTYERLRELATAQLERT